MEKNYDDGEYFGYDRAPILSMKIPPHIELKLENNQTNVFVEGEYVETCMKLKVIIPKENIRDYDHISSIDELSDYVSDSDLHDAYSISPEEEFWGHCSNIQAWVENDYDTRILHSNIAFPLLKRLTNIGDPLANNIFKEEIAERFSSGMKIVILFLLEDDYLNYLDEFEKKVLFESIKINFVKFTISEFYQFVNLCENIFLEVGKNARSSFLMNNLNEISNFIVEHLSKPKFDIRKLHTLYESLNKLMSFLIRYEKLFFDFEIANYKIKKYFITDADAEIRDDSTIYIQYKNQIFFTETKFSYSFWRYDGFFVLKNALFGNENIIFSDIRIYNFDRLMVEVILCSKKAEEFYNRNFANISDWIKLKHSVINHLTNLDQIDLDFIDKIHYIYLIIWNLLCQRPKQTEIRYIKQTNFYFEIIEYYNTKDCDVSIDFFNYADLHQREFSDPSYEEQRFGLIVKNRNEQVYRRYQGEELHDIIKHLFFRNENLIIEAAFWRRHKKIFEISVKYNSKKNE